MGDDGRTIVVGSTAGLLEPRHVEAIEQAMGAGGIRGQPVFTYLANTIRAGDREIPYSLVTATNLDRLATARAVPAALGPRCTSRANDHDILLTEWAARDLQVAPGDRVSLEYYLWTDGGQLVTRSADFRLAGIVPTGAGSRDLVPTFPGMSDAPSLEDWDPPFPIDLSRIRPVDEQYWDDYRTTPKAFVAYEAGRDLWRSRYGEMTSIRVPAADAAAAARERAALAARLRDSVDPLALGLTVRAVRAEGVSASRGATDFGRVLRLLQLLPGRLGAAARVAVLQARHRAACPRGRVAARRRLRHRRRAPALPRRRGACSRASAARWACSAPSAMRG